jgi:hypothetical protein
MDQVRRVDEEDDAFEYNSKVAKYSPNSADETLRPLCDALTGQPHGSPPLTLQQALVLILHCSGHGD